MKIHTGKYRLLIAAICAAGRAGAKPSVRPVGTFLGGDMGDYLTLRLRANGRFRFERSSCVGPWDRNYGRYRVKDGIVILSPRRPNIRKGFTGTPTRFLIVTWGKRLYLVPQDEVRSFCKQVNERWEPRTLAFGGCYLREGDRTKMAGGSPDLPAKYRSLLLPESKRGKPLWLDPKVPVSKLRNVDSKGVRPVKSTRKKQ